MLISKILDSQENSLCKYCMIYHLTLPVLLRYLVKLGNYNSCRFQWCIACETSEFILIDMTHVFNACFDFWTTHQVGGVQ